MYKIIYIMFILLVCIFLSSCGRTDYKVYYAPIGMHFYGIQHPRDVESHGMQTELSSSDMDELFKNINKDNIIKEVDLREEDLRIKVERKIDGKVVWVSNQKEVISEGNAYLVTDWRLDQAIHAIIDSLKKMEKYRKVPYDLLY